MKKKDKKKLKKKGKIRLQGNGGSQVAAQKLEQRVKNLENEIKQHMSTIDALTRQLKGNKAGKGKKSKPDESALNALFIQQKSRVGVDQNRAWKRHGYLRDRYEFHLNAGQSITNARIFAGQDLKLEFGDDAGYSEQELEHILS